MNNLCFKKKKLENNFLKLRNWLLSLETGEAGRYIPPLIPLASSKSLVSP